MEVNVIEQIIQTIHQKVDNKERMCGDTFRGSQMEKDMISHIKQSIQKQLQFIKSTVTSLKPSLTVSSPSHSRENSLEGSNPFAIGNEIQNDQTDQLSNIANLPIHESIKDDKIQSLQTFDKLQTSKNHLFQLLIQLQKQSIIKPTQQHQQNIRLLQAQNDVLKQKLINYELSQHKFRQKCQQAFNQYSKQLNREKMQLKQLVKTLQAELLQKDNIKVQLQKRIIALSSEVAIYKEEMSKKQKGLQLKINDLQSQLQNKKKMTQNHGMMQVRRQQQLAHLQKQNKKVICLNRQLQSLNEQQQNTIKQFTFQNIKANQQLNKLKETIIEIQSQNPRSIHYQEPQIKIIPQTVHSDDEYDYLKEQNQYLRTQIINFNDMKKELQDRTLSLEKKYNKAKEEWRLSKEEIKDRNSYIQKVQLQAKRLRQNIQQMNIKFQQQKRQCSASYMLQIQELATQLNDLKQQLNQHLSIQPISQNLLRQHSNFQHHIQSLQTTNQQLQLQLQLINSEFNRLKQQHRYQLQLSRNSKEVYELQMIKFQQSSVQDHRVYQNLVKIQRQNYQLSLNMMNEQLLQEKYRNSQLSQKLKSLQALQSKQMAKSQQIQLLKRQLQLLSKYSAGNRSQGGNALRFKDVKQEVVEYYMVKIKQQSLRLNQQYSLFKGFVNQCMKELYSLMEEFALQFHQYCYGRDHNSHRSYNLIKHRNDNIQHDAPVINIDLLGTCKPFSNNPVHFQSPNKTFNRQAVPSVNHLKNIKKTLKNIQSRYTTANQQNKFYSSHLDNFIKKM